MTGILSWSVAQIYNKRTEFIRAEIEKGEHSTFIPTYKRRWASDGKISESKRAMLPGYILFQSTQEWGDISAIDGVIRVLSKGGSLSAIDARRIFLGSEMGEHNQIEAEYSRSADGIRRRRRRPRASRRARAV